MPTVLTLEQAAGHFAIRGQFADKMRIAVLKGLYSSALFSKNYIVSKEIPNADPPPVNKGVYRAGWQVQKLPNGAAFYNSVPYARYIEWGVPAMNVVTSAKAIEALAEWARKKFGGLEEKQALRVAHAIMTNMRKHGIFGRGKGLQIMTKYAIEVLPGVIEEELTREINNIYK